MHGQGEFGEGDRVLHLDGVSELIHEQELAKKICRLTRASHCELVGNLGGRAMEINRDTC